MSRLTKTRTLILASAGLGFLSIGIAAYAQTVPSKPGLWASASEVVLNGKKMPTIFEINGVPEAKKQQLRQSMAAAGLPAGWNPSLTCETASEVDIQQVLASMKADGCVGTITSRTPTHITADLQCKSPQGNSIGKADVSGVSTSTVTYVINMTGMLYGKPMTYKASTTSKFLGSDCSNLPAGIDPSMVDAQH
jgi:hypothetical protein